MDVQEFLVFFRNDIPKINDIDWTFEKHKKWHPIFLDKTSDFHQKVKQSYFEQTNKLIEENDFQKYYGIGKLSEFAYLGLFVEEDEFEFSNLIRKLTSKLHKTENESEIKIILDFIYNFTDFLLHEYYPNKQGELRKVLIDLKMKILEIDKYESEKTGELIIRFIDLMQPKYKY